MTIPLDLASYIDQVRRINPLRFTGDVAEVTTDTNLEAGGIIFETSRGHLDASLHSQLDEIERGLIDRLTNRRGGRG